MKIGIVDLDTSHPAAWIPIERELGHEIVGVFDGGSIHPPEYVQRFAGQHKTPKVFDSLRNMVREVDCAIIHGCDWDKHVEKRGRSLKPAKPCWLTSRSPEILRDLKKFHAWAKQGARITGGSSLRFCNETRQWLDQPVAERGSPHTALCGCATDEFNYGTSTRIRC